MLRFSGFSMFAAAVLGLAAVNATHAHGPTIYVRAEDGRITTSFHDPGTGITQEGLRVFRFSFGVDPEDPWFVSAPGYTGPVGSGFPAGTAVVFNLRADLRYWNGQGAVSFGPVPQGETLRVNLGALNATAGAGTGMVSGFSIATVAADGSFHRHLNYFLNGPDGNNDPSDGGAPAEGVYLLELELVNSGLAASMPYWFVFNNGLDACRYDEAVRYVALHLAGNHVRPDLDADRDVDADDVTAFVACASGPSVPYSDPCCAASDFDDDGDVDQEDFGRLQDAFTGPGGPAGP